MNKLDNQKDDKQIFSITIIDSDNIKNICLNDFNKDKITFGRGKQNDIEISSLLISKNHGYFEIIDDKLKIVDSDSTNGIFLNNNKIKNSFLKDGDAVKIDNPYHPLEKGIIIIPTYGRIVNDWNQFELKDKDRFYIGRSDECDIKINHISVSLQHAVIGKINNDFVIADIYGNSGIIINGQILRGQKVLKDKDVILIANTKLIYSMGRIIYQIYNSGVRLDVIDIVKTVRVKGKKRNISKNISLSVLPGQFVSLVGGSGAGKSTFLKCISGVTTPTSGEVYINGEELFHNYSVLKNIIGYVPQQDIVHTDLTLIDMLKYAADLRMPEDTTDSEKKKRIDEVLDIVELTDKKNVMISNLSGGQKKRASIAVELIADPKLFFLDEPTSGLDPGTERSIMHTLRKMADSGKTIILVTHTTLNLHLCDKVVFLGQGGHLCFSGTPRDCLNFFGVKDFVDIYNLLGNDAPIWKEKYDNSQYREKVVINKKKNDNKNIYKNNKSFFKQFGTLTKRYLKTIFNNKNKLLLLLLQAPLIAYFLSLASSETVFSEYQVTKNIIFALSTGAMWLGLFNSIQEICKERVILEKEYMADLKISAYLTSKFVVQCIIGIIQAILFISVLLLFIEVPSTGVEFKFFTNSWYFQMILVCFLTIISASSIGLFVSSFTKDSGVAISCAPLVLIPELIFSGIILPLEGGIEKLSNLILCKWAVSGFGIINNLNGLPDLFSKKLPPNIYQKEIEDLYTFTSERLVSDIGIIVFMTIVLLFLCYGMLKFKLKRGR